MSQFVNIDPLATLSSAMVEATGAVSSDTATALAFIRIYSPDVADQIIPAVESMRLRMTPGALTQLERLGTSLSMRELLNRVTMNIGS